MGGGKSSATKPRALILFIAFSSQRSSLPAYLANKFGQDTFLEAQAGIPLLRSVSLKRIAGDGYCTIQRYNESILFRPGEAEYHALQKRDEGNSMAHKVV